MKISSIAHGIFLFNHIKLAHYFMKHYLRLKNMLEISWKGASTYSSHLRDTLFSNDRNLSFERLFKDHFRGQFQQT
jgi:hypothetical protein